jgi:hypothetical protein
MESELIKTAGQWGPFAGLLLIVLMGAFLLLKYVLTSTAEREQSMQDFLRGFLPQMQQLNDNVKTNTDITVQIREKVTSCGERLAKRDQAAARGGD